jgi:nicotinamide-nucleotide amidase
VSEPIKSQPIGSDPIESADSHPLLVEDAAARVVAELSRRGATLAVAESLTGGLLAAEIVSVPGASAVFRGGIVAYDTAIKHSVLGVDAALLAERGAVDASVAQQMAERVRSVLAVEGRGADYGLSTTGVAGPEPQDGQSPGTVFIALASSAGITVRRLRLDGDRATIRALTVQAALALLLHQVAPA